MRKLSQARKDLLVKKLIALSGWIVSCVTKEQAQTCVDMLHSINHESYGSKDEKLIYNLGITTGIVKLHLHHMKKEQDKLK